MKNRTGKGKERYRLEDEEQDGGRGGEIEDGG